MGSGVEGEAGFAEALMRQGGRTSELRAPVHPARNATVATIAQKHISVNEKGRFD
jgi:hypothetical protein